MREDTSVLSLLQADFARTPNVVCLLPRLILAREKAVLTRSFSMLARLNELRALSGFLIALGIRLPEEHEGQKSLIIDLD